MRCTPGLIERAIDRLVSQPESWIGCDAHRLFEQYGGVYRGTVMSYDDETKYWKVKYETDKELEEYDADDMEAYVPPDLAGCETRVAVLHLRIPRQGQSGRGNIAGLHLVASGQPRRTRKLPRAVRLRSPVLAYLAYLASLGNRLSRSP